MLPTLGDVVQLLQEALGGEVETAGDTFTFIGGPLQSALLPIEQHVLEGVVESISQYEMVNPACTVTDRSYEVIVDADSRLFFALRSRDDDSLRLEDNQTGLTYQLGTASASFAVYLGLRVREQVGDRWRRNFRMSALIRDRLRREKDAVDPLSAFQSIMRIQTLRLESVQRRNPTWWKPYADSFFFHLGYNLDARVMPQLGIDHLLEPSRITTMRRSTVRELDPPRRHYVDDLVHHYQLGVAAESAMLKYLSYYHVAEHWFENVFQDDLADQVQSLITSPDFSYRRKQDIRGLIRRVSKAIQVRDDEVVINEQTALRLTLLRYVDLARLLDDLNQFDPSLVARYAAQTVAFSGGDVFDLLNRDAGEVTAALGRRIYKTRNALVHSKEGAKGRFIPFKHDAELLPEVPLMRFIAEQIIVSTSKMTLPA